MGSDLSMQHSQYCQHEFPRVMQKGKDLVKRWRSKEALALFPEKKRAVAREVLSGCAEALEKAIKDSEFGP